jgi:hypothetical protein
LGFWFENIVTSGNPVKQLKEEETLLSLLSILTMAEMTEQLFSG